MVIVLIGAISALLLACGGGNGSGDGEGERPRGPAPDEPLRIGFLADFSGPLAEFGPQRQRGIRLAIDHINAGGGVHGKPVELFVADSISDPASAVTAARQLVETEGVHAIIGPFSSTAAIAVAEQVAGPAGVVMISPSATSPGLTTAADDDFLFRTTLSDAAQGMELARLVTEAGISKVGVLYLDDAYGQGLLEAFTGAFGAANVTASPIRDQAISYMDELQQIAGNGEGALLAFAYPTQAQVFVREALDGQLFERFFFADGLRSSHLLGIFGDRLDGAIGTTPGPAAEHASRTAWEAAYREEYGDLPDVAYIDASYDATIAIALAAAYANSNDSTAIRDALRAIAAPPGNVYIAGPESVRDALRAIQQGRDVDYDGASNALNWDAAGDVSDGYIHVWQFQAGDIVDLEVVAVSLR